MPVAIADLKKKPRQPPPLKRVTGAVRANVFVYLRDQNVETPDVDRPKSRNGEIVQVQAPPDEIPAIARNPGQSSGSAGFQVRRDTTPPPSDQALRNPQRKQCARRPS